MVNGPDLWLGRFPWPASDTHKHLRGSLVVVSGPMSRTGAARLAARAGLRIGAGVVTVLSPPGALMVNAMNLEAVMVAAFDDAAALEKKATGARAAVIGPAAGIGEATAENARALKRAGCALVLDADALTTFAAMPGALADLVGGQDVLTPHAGEFARMWPGLLAKGRQAAVQAAAGDAGCVVLLKGPETLIAAPEGRIARNPNGSPWLATAGSGDVLAGMIGGLMSQGVEAFDAACMAAWIHAETAAAFGPGLIAEDLPDRIPGVLSALHEKGRTP